MTVSTETLQEWLFTDWNISFQWFSMCVSIITPSCDRTKGHWSSRTLLKKKGVGICFPERGRFRVTRSAHECSRKAELTLALKQKQQESLTTSLHFPVSILNSFCVEVTETFPPISSNRKPWRCWGYTRTSCLSHAITLIGWWTGVEVSRGR